MYIFLQKNKVQNKEPNLNSLNKIVSTEGFSISLIFSVLLYEMILQEKNKDESYVFSRYFFLFICYS